MIDMSGKFKLVQCEDPCGFMVKSHDEKELVDIVRQHANRAHGLTISEKDVRDKMKSV